MMLIEQIQTVAPYPYAGTIRIRFKGSIRRCLRLSPPLRKIA